MCGKNIYIRPYNNKIRVRICNQMQIAECLFFFKRKMLHQIALFYLFYFFMRLHKRLCAVIN